MPESLPVVIGGDLNTHVGPGGHDDASEPLFAHGHGARLRLGGVQPGATDDTHQHLEPKRGHATARLVLHARRRVCDPAVVPALGDDASVLSDHELILVTLELD